MPSLSPQWPRVIREQRRARQHQSHSVTPPPTLRQMHVIQGGDLLRLTFRQSAAFERGDQDQIYKDCCGAQIISPICWAIAAEFQRSAT